MVSTFLKTVKSDSVLSSLKITSTIMNSIPNTFVDMKVDGCLVPGLPTSKDKLSKSAIPIRLVELSEQKHQFSFESWRYCGEQGIPIRRTPFNVIIICL